jgi:hypothetical protein
MMAALLLSTTVKSLKPRLAIYLSSGLCALWVVGVTLFWYLSVIPNMDLAAGASKAGARAASAARLAGAAKMSGTGTDTDTGAGAAAGAAAKESGIALPREDPRLPVTLVTGFLGSGQCCQCVSYRIVSYRRVMVVVLW